MATSGTGTTTEMLECIDDSDCDEKFYCRENQCVTASTCKELAQWGYESGIYWLRPTECLPQPFAKYSCNMDDPWTCVSFQRSYESLCGNLEENFFTPLPSVETPATVGLDTVGWSGPFARHSAVGRQRHSRIYQFRFAPFSEVQFRSVRVESFAAAGFKSDISPAFTGDSWVQINNFDGLIGDLGDVIFGHPNDNPGGAHSILLSFSEAYGQADSFSENEGYTLPNTTKSVIGQPYATMFRIAWGETSDGEFEGWRPWVSGEICFR